MYKRTIDDKWSFKDADTKDFTHCFHNYPAMMIPQIPRTLLRDYSPDGKIDLLFDPYMGSGTSLVEANIAGINAIGTDLNPLARLISKVKTTHYDVKGIQEAFSILQSNFPFYDKKDVKNKDFSRISNAKFWYSEDNLLKLSYLSQLIEQSNEYADFFKLPLSEVVREVSFTRNGEFKRYRMSQAQLQKFNPDAFKLFEAKTIRNIAGMEAFNRIENTGNSTICAFNTVDGIPKEIIPDRSVDMIITSPPYGDSKTTVAYGQFSRWANEWFGFDDAKNLDSSLMGGKPCKTETLKTKAIAAELEQIKEVDGKRHIEVVSFLTDYYNSISNVAKTVRRGGIVCYVVGNRIVKNVQIPLDFFTVETFTKFGFSHIDTIVREIPNKRMPSKTSPTNKPGAKVSTMTNEYIVIMEKTGENL